MKPIEPGCLCVIVGGDPDYIGDAVTAIKRVSAGESVDTCVGVGVVEEGDVANRWMVEGMKNETD